MNNKHQINRVYFVSTGRCGTTRLAEILRQNLPDQFLVMHQSKFSRLSNIAGNIDLASDNWLKLHLLTAKLHPAFKDIEKEKKILICTDPLISLSIPYAIYSSEQTAIIHIIRDRKEFSKSMYNFTRTKKASFIAHNFIPFWQPGLFPLENLLSRNILQKYEKIHTVKTVLFRKRYTKNPHYLEVSMPTLFSQSVIEQLIYKFWFLSINIPDSHLRVKSNQSVPNRT